MIREADGFRLLSLDPLTIEPSIRCACGAHGRITEGRWVTIGTLRSPHHRPLTDGGA